MISLRHHAISIAAIFLALAVGVVLGSQTIASGVLSGLRDDKSDLQKQTDQLQAKNNQLQAQIGAADGFNTATAPRVLHDVLAKRTVVVITTPDADPRAVDGVTQAIQAAGGSVSGKVALTDSFVDGSNGDRLRTTLNNVIPAGVQLHTGAVDQGSMAGDLLGSVLLLNPQNAQPQSTPQEMTLALQTLRSGGFLDYADGAVHPGQLAVVLTGDGAAKNNNGNRGSLIARFAGALRSRGAGTVLAGPPAAAEGNGPIAVVRADAALSSSTSTVDDVDREAGRITTVLALQEQLNGGSGRYGTGPKANAVTVGARPS